MEQAKWKPLGIIGMTFGMTGFVFGILSMRAASTALAQISKLEAQLKETGALQR